MSARKHIEQSPEFDDTISIVSEEIRHLVLHNDDVHTFEYVIASLIDICQHEIHQAEQCAYIVHYKGKCDVKNGTYETLRPMREGLTSKGLSVTID